MATKIFVNLPVKDLDKSVAFFTKLGFSFNAQFTNENATCMIVGEDIYFMLLVHDFFKKFINKEIADTSRYAEVINCLSADSKEKVDELVNLALEAGATAPKEPMDEGFMYQRSFEDLDGHLWEIVWMDPAAMNPQ
jgi:predicted lactoylglutathione lyase